MTKKKKEKITSIDIIILIIMWMIGIPLLIMRNMIINPQSGYLEMIIYFIVLEILMIYPLFRILKKLQNRWWQKNEC